MNANSLSKPQFEILAHFRYQLRKFERFSELLTRRHGVTQLQYLLLLQIEGFPGKDWASIAELAERLQAHQHGVTALVNRCEKLGWVVRSAGRKDRRQVEVHLTEAGWSLVNMLARAHRDELLALQRVFAVPEAENLVDPADGAE